VEIALNPDEFAEILGFRQEREEIQGIPRDV